MTKSLTHDEMRLFKEKAKLALIYYYIKNGLKTRKSVEKLVNKALPVRASSRVMCNHKDHCSQLDFLTEVLTKRVDMYILWANRTGSKTYFIALVEWLKSLMYPGRECLILGGSGEQSKLAYKATDDFWSIGTAAAGAGRPLESTFLKRPPTKENTAYKNGSRMAILMASENSVRGPHPQALCLDEVDVMAENILTAALSQPKSKDGIPATTSISSTNHVMGGLMDEQLDKAYNNPYARVFKWCVWDILEACQGNCNSCELFKYCPGEQMKQATGYYKIADFIQKMYQLSPYSLEVEWFCNKVGHPDLIYKNDFDESRHMIDYSFSNAKMGFISVDWGGINPFSLGYWQKSESLNAWVRIDEIILSPDKDGAATNGRLIDATKKKPYWNYISGGVGDPSEADSIREWRDAGINMHGADNRVNVGLERVKGALNPVLGNPKIYFSKSCKNTRREFYSYKHGKDKPIKENDHSMDDIRYFVMEKINTDGERAEAESIPREESPLDNFGW